MEFTFVGFVAEICQDSGDDSIACREIVSMNSLSSCSLDNVASHTLKIPTGQHKESGGGFVLAREDYGSMFDKQADTYLKCLPVTERNLVLCLYLL